MRKRLKNSTPFYRRTTRIRKIYAGKYIERRRTWENKKLKDVHKQLMGGSFSFSPPERREILIGKKLHFKGKKDNINGLQVVDFFAYDILIHWMSEKERPLLDVRKEKRNFHQRIIDTLESKKLAGGYALCHRDTWDRVRWQ